jgi:ATP-dependent HslUV protease ATP-binding subunit HslU
LYTITEKLLEEISFEAPDRKGQRMVIDESFVRSTLSHITKNEDLSKFIL